MMARNDWYYAATISWTQAALDAHPNKHFNGYEMLGSFESEAAARQAIAQAFDRPEISHGFVFYQRDIRSNQVETRWRKSVDRPDYVATPLQAMIRDALTNPDGTDRMDDGH